MAFCPSCGYEYEAWMAHCPDCEEPLVDNPPEDLPENVDPPEDVEFVPVEWQLLVIAPNEMEAHFIRGRLESAGIPVRISAESMASLYGVVTGSLAKARVFVPEENYSEARELLATELSTDDDPQEPGE